MVPICFICKDASNAMQSDPLGSKRDLMCLGLKSKFEIDLFMSLCMVIFRRVSMRGT